MSLRSLILETSGRVGQAALGLGPDVLHERRLDEARRHTRDLAPAVTELLALAGWKPRDVQAVLVSRGPGSYTGLRVGIMSAKAFAYATKCALLAVDTFAAIGMQAPTDASVIHVLEDAQQDKVYAQTFARTESGLQSRMPLAICPFADWVRSVEPPCWVTGPGVRRREDRFPAHVTIVEETQRQPLPASLLRLAWSRLQAGERDDLWSLEPLYLRASSAEEKWSALGR